jgi:hypothetical protein
MPRWHHMPKALPAKCISLCKWKLIAVQGVRGANGWRNQRLISRKSAGDYVACRPRVISAPYAAATANSCVLSRKGFAWVSCSAARSFREQTLIHSRSIPTATQEDGCNYECGEGVGLMRVKARIRAQEERKAGWG